MVEPSVREDSSIDVAGRPSCVICGSAGEVAYTGVTDRIHDFPGSWTIRRGKCGECRALWLDPAPIERDIPKLYARAYFTHNPETGLGFSRQWSDKEHQALHANLGYPLPADLHTKSTMKGSPFAMRTEAKAMWLQYKANGKILDYGCGNGLLLRRLAAIGWTIFGYETDPIAAEVASRDLGTEIWFGDITAKLAKPSFEAVTMSHVIEHLPDARPVLRGLYESLTPGGVLSIATPNAGSLAERVFGSSWYGLQPPFHLYIYERRSLQKLFDSLGFSCYRIWTSPNSAHKFWLTSSAIRRGRRPHTGNTMGERVGAKAFAVTERIISVLAPRARLGEDLCALIQKT